MDLLDFQRRVFMARHTLLANGTNLNQWEVRVNAEDLKALERQFYDSLPPEPPAFQPSGWIAQPVTKEARVFGLPVLAGDVGRGEIVLRVEVSA